VLVYLEAMYLKTKEPIYDTAARFWTGIFAVNFAVGVATGIVMEFQFGTNWAVYSRFVGDVFGSALAAEGIFAFFLESGFLSILVFGRDKVGPQFHFFATLMVSLGSIFSSVWIIVANSWQQTPAGHHIVQMMRDGHPWFIDGNPVMRAEIVDFWQLLLSPSAIDRLVHTLIGAFLMGAFFVMSISAYYVIRRRHEEFAKRSFTGALVLGTVFSLCQLISGHSNARMVAHYQPAKLAAFEAHFKTGVADLNLFGIPNLEAKTVDHQIALPGMLSFLVSGDSNSSVIGLDKVPREFWPPVKSAFTTYHVMISIGMFFIVLTLYACFLRWRGTLFEKRWLMQVFVGAVALAVIANQLGWASAEIGRQPWTVHPNLLRDSLGKPLFNSLGFIQYKLDEGLLTSRAISESITSGQVLASIFMFSFIYLLLLAVWIFVLNHKIQAGPEGAAPTPQGGGLLDAVTIIPEHLASLSGDKSK
jgi:cytochrome d ubiquinol oxidase subunit I